MKVHCTGLSSPSYAEEQALKRMTGPYQHTKKSRIGNRKRTLFYHRPCELITCVFVSKKTFDHGLFYCDEASLNYAFSPFYPPLDTSFAHPVLLLETPYRYTSY
jgi:hypothetical protein